MVTICQQAEVVVLCVVLWFSGPATAYYYSKGRGSGCKDGTSEGFQDERHPQIAACEGEWRGHVSNGSSLCAFGWRVCSHYDQRQLKTINWKDATGLAGCYAINAAQDGGQCRECISHMEQDDLAGVGRGCPHQSYGQKSCISGGQIDVSCCVDTHFNRACEYRPGLASGVLCCKLPGVPPQILVEPQRLTHVTTGVTFVLSCQAIGSPTPTVSWWRNKHLLANNISRISVFDSGYLLISQAQPSDSGTYQCVVSNVAGKDKSDAKIIVTDYPSGCSDGTTDGFHEYEDIHACRGRWEGHIKRGRSLCTRGWHVCSPKHVSTIKLLTWTDINRLKGCYAYNAANTLNQCARCHWGDMAGVGSNCGRIRRTHRSCLAEGRMDVFKGKQVAGCYYSEGHTTGVLCCKKQKKIDPAMNWVKPPECTPKCDNGGICVEPNRCKCASGYKGAWCQNAICPGSCIPNSICIKPGVCRCKSGYTGEKCVRRDTICRQPCRNGGRCKQGKCKCPKTHFGPACQHLMQWRPLTDLNRTER